MKTLSTALDSPHFSSKRDNQRSVNVLYIIGSLPFGGAENQVITLASALSVGRHTIYVCCLRHEGVQANILRRKGIQVIELNMRLRSLPKAIYRLYRLIKLLKPQIVHTHLYEADLWGRLVAKVAGVPVIITTVHGMFYWRKNRNWLILDLIGNYFTDKMIAVSEEIRQCMIQNRRESEEKIITIPNAVDIERFNGPNSRSQKRKELGINAASPLVGTVARLVPEKCLEDLIKAAQLVCEVVPQARFLIIGDGPSREELEKQARQLNLSTEIITFLGSREDVPDLLSALDIFVLSSETEGLPVSMLEAMAASRPVIATRVGGIPHVIQDGYSGLLISPHDSPGLSKAILTFLGNRSLCESVAKEAYQIVEARFSTRVVCEQIAALYDGLLIKKVGRVK